MYTQGQLRSAIDLARQMRHPPASEAGDSGGGDFPREELGLLQLEQRDGAAGPRLVVGDSRCRRGDLGERLVPLRGRQLAGDHGEGFRADFDVRPRVGPQVVHPRGSMFAPA